MYAYRVRPSGLTYNIVAQNSGWIQKGEKPWNAGIHTGPNPDLAAKLRGRRLSPATEFKPGQAAWNAGLRGVMPEGERHHAWTGDQPRYSTVHGWVRRHLVKPAECAKCGSDRNIDWSNVSGEYRRDPSDWQALCRSCHIRYDRAVIPGAGNRKRLSCAAS